MTTRYLLVLLAVFLVAGAALALVPAPLSIPGRGEPVACSQEALQCPDGSYVSRTGPNREFAACPAATSTPMPTPGGGGGVVTVRSGIRGMVLLGPTCPVERIPPDPQCAPKPYATQISVAPASDPMHPIVESQSNSQGVFQVSLPPGSYVVRAAGGSTLPRCSPTDATVSPNSYTSITVSCDTGIR